MTTPQVAQAHKVSYEDFIKSSPAKKPEDDGMAFDSWRDREDSARERDMVRQENDQNDRIAEGY